MEEQVLAETENFSIILLRDPDGEPIYDINIDQVTLHLIKEDFDEFVALVSQIKPRRNAQG